jgi:hypothetical protein
LTRCATVRLTMCAVFQQVQLVFPTIVTGNMEEHVNRPAEFLPERWLKSPSDSLYRIHPFASLPYGHGARMCLGRRFADMEIQILLAKASRCIVTLYIPWALRLIRWHKNNLNINLAEYVTYARTHTHTHTHTHNTTSVCVCVCGIFCELNISLTSTTGTNHLRLNVSYSSSSTTSRTSNKFGEY